MNSAPPAWLAVGDEPSLFDCAIHSSAGDSQEFGGLCLSEPPVKPAGQEHTQFHGSLGEHFAKASGFRILPVTPFKPFFQLRHLHIEHSMRCRTRMQKASRRGFEPLLPA